MTQYSDPSSIRLPAGMHLAVVGGCGGIGQAIVRAAVAQQCHVHVLDLARSLEQRELPDGVTRTALDLRQPASIGAAFAALRQHTGHLDGLVNTAGFTTGLLPLSDTVPAQMDEVQQGNLLGPLECCRHALPLLQAAPAASIVNVSTGIASIGAAGYGAYAIAKAGLNAMTRVLAAEAAPGIRVNAIAPGGVDTAFLRGGYGRGGSEEGRPLRLDVDEYSRRVPLGRIGHPDDVAAPVLFLLSAASAYISGQVIHVNGGALMRD